MTVKKTPDWLNAESEATEKKTVKKVTALTNYELIDQRFEDDFVTSDKRRESTETKDLFVKCDIDIVELLNRQQATKAASVNALLRFAIDELAKKKKRLNVK